jgi:hypothetical protein
VLPPWPRARAAGWVPAAGPRSIPGSFGSLAENHVDCGLAIFGEVFESFDRLETEAAKERPRGVANCGEHLRGMAGVGSRLYYEDRYKQRNRPVSPAYLLRRRTGYRLGQAASR